MISRGAIPDGGAFQTHIVAENNRVASRSVWDGTIAQSGRPADFTTLDFFRIEDGVVAERNVTFTRLEAAKLLMVNRDAAGTLLSLDTHPLLRGLARVLRALRSGTMTCAQCRSQLALGGTPQCG